MSDKKRRRINTSAQEATTVELVKETVQTPTQKVTEKKEDDGNDFSEFYDESGEFKWEAYEATCVTATRTANPHIKTQDGDQVFSREPYAQELYDIMKGASMDIKPQLFAGEIHEGIIHGVTEEWITIDIN